MGHPRGVLHRPRAMSRAAGDEGRAVPPATRVGHRVALGTHVPARALHREMPRRAAVHGRARRAGDERVHHARVQRIAE